MNKSDQFSNSLNTKFPMWVRVFDFEAYNKLCAKEGVGYKERDWGTYDAFQSIDWQEYSWRYYSKRASLIDNIKVIIRIAALWVAEKTVKL